MENSQVSVAVSVPPEVKEIEEVEVVPSPVGFFSDRVQQENLIPTVEAFEILTGRAGQRIQIKNNPVFEGKYSTEELRADIVESDRLFREYFKESSGRFNSPTIAEGLIKVGGKYGLFGSRAEVMQSSQFDDYKHNADFIVKIQNDIRDKKDEKLLRTSVPFVLDVTIIKGALLNEKVTKLSKELTGGELTEIKYFPGLSGSLRDVPRFILQIDDNELLEFFKKAKPSLDRAGGVDEKRFTEQYGEFSVGVCEKILSNAQVQIKYIAECAIDASLPSEVSTHMMTLLSSPLGGFYQTLEYVDGINVGALGITRGDKVEKVTRYLTMIKKILWVGVAVERVLEEKEKRASTRQTSEALH